MKKELFICLNCGHHFETTEYRKEYFKEDNVKVKITTCTVCGLKIFKKMK